MRAKSEVRMAGGSPALRYLMGAFVALALVAAGSAVKAGGSYGSQSEAGMDIVDTAVAAGSFKTLATALQKADLVETLKGEGPFTVFAPTDEAFAQIPRDQLDALLADKEALARVLTYHVVPGKMAAADVAGTSSMRTVEGGNLTVTTMGGVKVDGANVIKTDIVASNGIIHVIDRVVMPK